MDEPEKTIKVVATRKPLDNNIFRGIVPGMVTGSENLRFPERYPDEAKDRLEKIIPGITTGKEPSPADLVKLYKARPKFNGTLAPPKLTMTGRTEEGEPCFHIENNQAWIEGCFCEKSPKRLYLWACMSETKGSFKPLVDYLVIHFKCNIIEFTNVIGYSMHLALHGFRLKKRYWKVAQEWIDNLVGKWKVI